MTAPTLTRLNAAERVGYLFSLQRETYLRDRYAKVCCQVHIPICHLISGPDPLRGSVRINGASVPALLGLAGQAIARAIATEHGGTIRRLDDQVVEVTSLGPIGAALLLHRLLHPELWFVSEGMER